MIAKDLINYMIPPLKPNDTVEKAKQWMEELRVSELPVSENGKYLGLFTEDMVFNEDLAAVNILEVELDAKEVMVYENDHYYEVLKQAYSNGIRVIAIVDSNENYLGVVSIEDVIEAFAGTVSVNTPGAILILKMEYRDYSLAEIARIVESNDVKILSSHLSSHSDDMGSVTLTLKLNIEDASHIISHLGNNGYEVADSFNKHELNATDSDRLDNLLNYLNI